MFNKLVAGLLRSPLHPLMSWNTMLIQYTGRKTGRSYTLPVNFVQLNGDLLTTSLRTRVWWRNLRNTGGRELDPLISLRIRGREVPAAAQVLESHDAVEHELQRYLSHSPGHARFFKVKLDEAGNPHLADIRQAAAGRVIILFRIRPPHPHARS